METRNAPLDAFQLYHNNGRCFAWNPYTGETKEMPRPPPHLAKVIEQAESGRPRGTRKTGRRGCSGRRRLDGSEAKPRDMTKSHKKVSKNIYRIIGQDSFKVSIMCEGVKYSKTHITCLEEAVIWRDKTRKELKLPPVR